MFLYDEGRSLLLNLTNRCPTACSFCVKTAWDWNYKGADLRLSEGEPSAEEVISALRERLAEGRWDEVVFSGYGDCVYRLQDMTAIGLHLKIHFKGTRVRVETVGLGNLIWSKDIVPQLALFADEVSVSLGTADPEQWHALYRPAAEFGHFGFAAARRFAERCVAAGIKTRVTAVQLPGVELDALRNFAERIGAGFTALPPLA